MPQSRGTQMYAWGARKVGPVEYFRSGESKEPQPLDTAVADSIERERKNTFVASPVEDSPSDAADPAEGDFGSEPSPGYSDLSEHGSTTPPAEDNATDAPAVAERSRPPTLAEAAIASLQRKRPAKGAAKGPASGSGGQVMPLLQEDHFALIDRAGTGAKNRSRDQQGLQAQSPSFLRPPAGAQRCKIPAPPQVPAAKKRSPSRKRRSRSRISLSPSPIPSGKSPSPCRKSPSPSRSRSSKRRKLDAGKASTRMQAKQQTPQSREPQPQEPQPQQQEPQPQPQCRAPSRKSGSPIRKGRSPSSQSSSHSRRRSPSRKIRSPSRKSRRPTRKSRKSRSPCRSRGQITHALHAVAGHQLFLGLREGIVERAALGYDAIPSADLLPVARDPNQPLPASVGMGNLMAATWAVGRDCDAKLLGEKLCKAPFDFTLLVMSTAVAEDDDIYSFLCELSSLQSLPPAERALSNEKRSPRWYLLREVLEEKTVHCLGRSGVTGSPTHLPPSGWKGRATFVALHKAKVTNASYEDHYIRSRGPDSGIDFGTLRLTMDQSRQRMPEVRVGRCSDRCSVPGRLGTFFT